jgi:hypothetical protein
MYFTWSPDGKSIAFGSDKSGSWDIWVLMPEEEFIPDDRSETPTKSTPTSTTKAEKIPGFVFLMATGGVLLASLAVARRRKKNE